MLRCPLFARKSKLLIFIEINIKIHCTSSVSSLPHTECTLVSFGTRNSGFLVGIQMFNCDRYLFIYFFKKAPSS